MQYEDYSLVDLRLLAKDKGIKNVTKLKKQELIDELTKIESNKEELKEVKVEEKEFVATTVDGLKLNTSSDTVGEGILEILPDGFGFLRGKNYLSTPNDIYVSPTQIKRFKLDNGDKIRGITRKPQAGERFPALIYIGEINGRSPEDFISRKKFDDLKPIYPNEKIKLETDKEEYATRIMDLLCPIGKGQRGLIVAPPKVGKTTIIKKIANAITTNNPEVELIVLLIDERPEEVTDMEESIKVEAKKDVVILLDSITRLARAYNLTINASGRTLSGGLDPAALHYPKKFLGAARNIEGGGSLTILASALVDTGSKMDEVIFEELKGTGNMEVVLDRSLSERRIFPAISLTKSGTRREDLLLSKDELDVVYQLRKSLLSMKQVEVIDELINLVTKTNNNVELVEKLKTIFKK